jgi:hypothetical protein
MAHDEHVWLLARCETPRESPERQALYEQVRLVRVPFAIAATMRAFAGRGFVTSSDWRHAELTAAGKDRLAAERAVLLSRET